MVKRLPMSLSIYSCFNSRKIFPHMQDMGGIGQSCAYIMGNHQYGNAVLPVQSGYQSIHFGSHLRIQAGYRFIQKQQLPVAQRARAKGLFAADRRTIHGNSVRENPLIPNFPCFLLQVLFRLRIKRPASAASWHPERTISLTMRENPFCTRVCWGR